MCKRQCFIKTSSFPLEEDQEENFHAVVFLIRIDKCSSEIHDKSGIFAFASV